MKREERLTNILLYMQQKRTVTIEDIMQKFGVANRTVKRDIYSLKKRGIRIASMHGPNGGYELIRAQDAYQLSLNRKESSLLYYAVAFMDIKGKPVEECEVEELMKKLKDLVQDEEFLI